MAFNTIVLSFAFIMVHTMLQAGFSLMLTEVGNKTSTKVSRSVIVLPHFVSWVIVGVFVCSIFSCDPGPPNSFLVPLRMARANPDNLPEIWPYLPITIHSRKSVRFGVIIYPATLAGISPEHDESAMIDGASRWQLTRHISIALFLPSMAVLTLPAVGRILHSGFGMLYGIIGNKSMPCSATRRGIRGPQAVLPCSATAHAVAGLSSGLSADV